MNSEQYEWYKPRRSFRQIRVFIIVFGIMTAAGIIPVVFGMPGPGFALSGMGILFLALIVPQAAAVGQAYGIGNTGIILKKSRSLKQLRFAEIESAALLSEENSRLFMEELYRASVDAERQLDFGGWLRSLKKAGEVIRYLSVSVTGTETRAGSSTNITSYSVRPGAELILLRTRTGPILISPQDIRKFYSLLTARGVRNIPPAAGEGLAVQFGTASVKNRRGFIRLLSALTAVVIILLVGYFYIYPQFRDRGVQQQPVSQTKAGADAVSEPEQALLCFWNGDDSFAFAVAADELPEMVRGGGLTSAMFSEYAAPMLLKLLESEGEISAGASEDPELIERTADFLMLHSRMSHAGEETAGDGSLYLVFVVEQTEIRKNIPQLIRNFGG